MNSNFDDLLILASEIKQQDPDIGRIRLSKELGCSERQTRKILEILKEKKGIDVNINGIFPSDYEPDPQKVLERLIHEQESVEENIEKRYSQYIEIKDSKPICIAFFSDKHMGSKYCDYINMFRDAEIVRDTDGMYAIEAGDNAENWIGKLSDIQRYNKIDYDAERGLVRYWFEIVGDKLLAVVSGNHENRTRNIAGIDYLREMLRNCKVLYDNDEVKFRLILDKAEIKVKVRHKWRGHSKYNQTHGIESDQYFGDENFDIGIGAHIHAGTLFREFIYKDAKRYSVLIGTYKLYDGYGVKCGFPKSYGLGCGAIVFFPNGEMMHLDSLGLAKEFLEFARNRKKRLV